MPQICNRNVGKQSKKKFLSTESHLNSRKSSNTVGSRHISGWYSSMLFYKRCLSCCLFRPTVVIGWCICLQRDLHPQEKMYLPCVSCLVNLTNFLMYEMFSVFLQFNTSSSDKIFFLRIECTSTLQKLWITKCILLSIKYQNTSHGHTHTWSHFLLCTAICDSPFAFLRKKGKQTLSASSECTSQGILLPAIMGPGHLFERL